MEPRIKNRGKLSRAPLSTGAGSLNGAPRIGESRGADVPAGDPAVVSMEPRIRNRGKYGVDQGQLAGDAVSMEPRIRNRGKYGGRRCRVYRWVVSMEPQIRNRGKLTIRIAADGSWGSQWSPE